MQDITISSVTNNNGCFPRDWKGFGNGLELLGTQRRTEENQPTELST